MLGPAVTDNGIVVRPLADDAEIHVSTTRVPRRHAASGCSNTRWARSKRSRACWSGTSSPSATAGSPSSTTARPSAAGTRSSSTPPAPSAASSRGARRRVARSRRRHRLGRGGTLRPAGRPRLPRTRAVGPSAGPSRRTARLGRPRDGQLRPDVRLRRTNLGLEGVGRLDVRRRRPRKQRRASCAARGSRLRGDDRSRHTGVHDLGRLVAEAIVCADHLTPAGLRDGLEHVKLLPAAIGAPGTTMGFGRWDRAALKGEFLVLRQWRDGESRLLGDGSGGNRRAGPRQAGRTTSSILRF